MDVGEVLYDGQTIKDNKDFLCRQQTGRNLGRHHRRLMVSNGPVPGGERRIESFKRKPNFA
jgi:hypothetical protein